MRILGPMLLLLACLPLRGEVVDQVIRYVGNEIITSGDLRERVEVRLALMRRANEALPGSTAEANAFLRETLDQITEEILLVQEARRLEVQVDDRPIRRELRERARALGQPMTLQIAKDAVSERIKRELIRAVVEFYAADASNVTPSDIAEAYSRRRDEFTRPARRRPLRILVRGATEDERDQLIAELLDVFRRAQVAEEPAVQDAVTEEARKAYVAARKDPAQQLAVLADVAVRVHDAVGADASADSRQLAADAGRALDRVAGLVTLEEAEAELAAAAERLAEIPAGGERIERFQKLAREISDGPRAPQGGDLGWSEAGSLGEPYTSVAEDLAVGELSAVFAAGEARCLLLLAEREPATVRGIAEVSAELRKELEHQRREQARGELVERLRARAAIEDLKPLTELDIAAGTVENARALAGEGDIETVVDEAVRAWE